MKGYEFFRYFCAGQQYVLCEAKADQWTQGQVLAKVLCDPLKGTGADTLILLQKKNKGVYCIQSFNELGEKRPHPEAGILSAADWVCTRGQIDHCLFLDDRYEKKVCRTDTGEYALQMEAPSFDAKKIPVSTQGAPWGKPISIGDIRLKLYSLSVGSPYAVCFLDWQKNLNWIDKVGPELEKHFLFPLRTNVALAFVLNPKNIMIRVWERDSGEQPGSVRASVAAAVVSIKNNVAQAPLWVHTKAGKSEISWSENTSIDYKANASLLFRGIFECTESTSF
ncbi:MAG: hypothetical protein KDD52_08185 [Bdellovibrionales bacterium]|nr:hypothetical protein [Bdellovibrionales bacterium]